VPKSSIESLVPSWRSLSSVLECFWVASISTDSVSSSSRWEGSISHRVKLASISRSSSDATLNWTPDTLTDSTCGAMPSARQSLSWLHASFEYPMTDRQYEPGPLGDGDEGGGGEQPASRVVPPDQRLKAGNAPSGELDLRLVVQL
jgi:hypothetical protein